MKSLVLMHLDDNMMDIAGNACPPSGPIKSSIFSDDRDISNGLYGTLWGVNNYFKYDYLNIGFWAVLKTDDRYDFIVINAFYNTVKFKCGEVMHLGTIWSAGSYINTYVQEQKNLDPDFISIKEVQIAGCEKWMLKNQGYNKWGEWKDQ